MAITWRMKPWTDNMKFWEKMNELDLKDNAITGIKWLTHIYPNWLRQVHHDTYNVATQAKSLLKSRYILPFCRLWMFRVWHCNCNAKLLQILHESFDFGTAIAAPNC
jgi:hypothetical protein